MFNVVHFGEDVAGKACLMRFNLPYVMWCFAFAIAMDKFRCLLCGSRSGYQMRSYVVLHDDRDFSAVEREFDVSLSIKPVAEGSSVVCFMVEQEDLAKNLSSKLKQNMARFCRKLIAANIPPFWQE